MGTLVIRKLHIFRPTRRYTNFYTLFCKQCFGQAWRRRGWEWGALTGKARRRRGSVPWIDGYRPLLLKQAVHKGLITKWHNDPAYSGRLTMKQHSLRWKSPWVSNNVCTHSCLCACVLMSVCALKQACVSQCAWVCAHTCDNFFMHLAEFKI